MTAAEWIWTPRQPDDGVVDALVEELECNPIVARILANRGISDAETADRFLAPTTELLHAPGSLPDVAEAVDRLSAAIEDGETITVCGDRDVDGTCGTAILLATLEDAGATVGYHFRGKYESFGLHDHHVDRLADRGSDVLVTVDCGTNDAEAIRHASTHDMDVIVTDHHEPDDAYPADVPCLNPHRVDDASPLAALTGAGVALKLGRALIERRDPDGLSAYLDLALPLAAVGTVVDRGRCTPENRAIARAGFARMERCPLPGFRAIVAHCEVESIRDIGWSLGPLLNGVRQDESGDLALRALLAEDPDRISACIETLEAHRDTNREERRAMRADLAQSVDEQVDAPEDILVVETDDYAVSVAGDTARRFGKPVFVYHRKNGEYYGGARAEMELDLRDLIEAASDVLDRAWGHAGAPGFVVPADHGESFFESVREELSRRYDPEELRPQLEIDAKLPVSRLTTDLVDALEALRPFGDGNEEPLFLLPAVELTDTDRFGHLDDHLELHPAAAPCRFVAWRGAHLSARWEGAGAYDIVGTVSMDGESDRPAVSVRDIAPA